MIYLLPAGDSRSIIANYCIFRLPADACADYNWICVPCQTGPDSLSASSAHTRQAGHESRTLTEGQNTCLTGDLLPITISSHICGRSLDESLTSTEGYISCRFESNFPSLSSITSSDKLRIYL
jgi:hypothetical protein